MIRTLYLCYLGLREPLAQTQVLPYLREVRCDNIDINLLTFEPNWPHSWTEKEKQDWQNRLRGDGINWRPLAYHKKPSLLATLFDVIIGALIASRMARQEKIDVLHARAHIPLAMALVARMLSNCKIVFDIRGLIADEYVDAGIWKKKSFVYKATKWIELIGIRQADQVIVLTEKMRNWLAETHPASIEKTEVIPCCTEISKFDCQGHIDKHRDLAEKPFEAVYAGSLTGLYLVEEIGRFFLALKSRWPNATLRVLTASSATEVEQKLRKAGLKEDDFWIGAVYPSQVPYYLSRANVGISFRKATFSQIAASPTKIPEYLAAGLPVVSNAGIGDSDEIIQNDRVGVIIRELNDEAYSHAVTQLEMLLRDPNLAERCRRSSQKRFDMRLVGGNKYRLVYKRLSESSIRGGA